MILEAAGAFRRTCGTSLAQVVARFAHLASGVLSRGTFVHAGGAVSEGLGRTACAMGCIARARGAGFMAKLADLAVGKASIGTAAFAGVLNQQQRTRTAGAGFGSLTASGAGGMTRYAFAVPFACACPLEFPRRATIHTAALIQDLLRRTAGAFLGGAFAALARKVTSLACAVHRIFSAGAGYNAFVFVQEKLCAHLTAAGAVLGRDFAGPTLVQVASQAYVARGRSIGSHRTGIRALSFPKEFLLQTFRASGALSIASLAPQGRVTWHAELLLVGILPLAAAISPVFAYTILQDHGSFAACCAVGGDARAAPATGIALSADALSIHLCLKLMGWASLLASAATQKQWSFTGAASALRGTAEAALRTSVTNTFLRDVPTRRAALFASTIYKHLAAFTTRAVGGITCTC